MRSSKAVFNFITLFCILSFCFTISEFLPSASAVALNNVQITIQTSTQANYFLIDAFNMTGYLEASTQTHYAGASFELPNGQYIFTVTANNGSYYPVPLLGAASSSQNSLSMPAIPIYAFPAMEYGYLVQQVSSSIAITIATQNVTKYPTNSLSVTVSYSNGTAAAGAYVSASVIGSSYYWGYEPDVITWAQSGKNGVATLVIPTAPVEINAWIWLPYSGSGYGAPSGTSSQVVNGSVIATPVYLGLAGSTIVIPPQTAVSITLQPQQANYWVTASIGSATPMLSSPTSSYAAGPGSVPYEVYQQQQGNPNLQNLQVPVSTTTPQPSASPTTSPSNPPSATPTIPEFPTVILVLTILVAASTITLIKFRKTRKTETHRN